MIVLALVVVVAAIFGALAAVAVRRQRELAKIKFARQPRRAPELEARIRKVLTGPTQKFGAIFTDYTVWKVEHETRLELTAGAPWTKLNEFTRCLVVRYLWRVLESLAGGAVVIVDSPPQQWNHAVDSGFRDQGFDWKTFGEGPQFVKE